MKNFYPGLFSIKYGHFEDDKEKIKGKVHKSKLWAIHRSYSWKEKKYRNRSWTISNTVLGLSLYRDYKTFDEACQCFQKVTEKFPALLTVSSEKHWSVIAKTYGNLIENYLIDLYRELKSERGKRNGN